MRDRDHAHLKMSPSDVEEARRGETHDGAPGGASPPAPFAWRPVLVIAAVVVGVLLVVAGRYGFHRDELYFLVASRHLDFGYVDQPPLTPLLTGLQAGLLGAAPAAIRVLPAFAIGAVVVLAADMARSFAGGRLAQVLAAAAVATGGGILAVGHLQSTATYDLLAWTIITALVIRLLRGADQRWWLAVGAVAGIGLQNKHLVAVLAVGLAVGLLATRRWAVFRSPWLWLAALLALAMWAPNLVWQATHGWPQLEMAGRIADRAGTENRVLAIPLQFIIAGVFTAPVLVAGVWWLLRDEAARPFRAIAVAYLFVLAFLLLSGGKGYYAAGLIPAILAAGALPLAVWMQRGRWRPIALAGALLGNVVVVGLVSLPLLPPAVLASTPIPGIYKENAEQVGWPELADTVGRALQGIPDGERASTVVFTGNYGEAGAISAFGPERGLPPVYSAHNSFADWGVPPESARTVIVLGYARDTDLLRYFERVAQVDIVRNGSGLQNDEEGLPVFVARDPRRPWGELWEELRHLD